MRKDYYAILGVSKNADQETIKASFRKKAKLLHPDKNPQDETAEEKFRELMEAYEILLDPVTRKKYDQGIHYHEQFRQKTSTKNSQGQKQKAYTFTDEEYHQRQEMARKYREKLKRKIQEEEDSLPSYSDFKYIMLSIPLAIALLFFVINLTRSKNENRLSEQQLKQLSQPPAKKSNSAPNKSPQEVIPFDMSISPLHSYFSAPVYDSLRGAVLRIENPKSDDVVVCLQNESSGKVIRNAYVNAGYFFLMDKIPSGVYSLRVMYGKKWDAANVIPTDSNRRGMFDSVHAYSYLPIGKIKGKSIEQAKRFPYQEDKVVVIPDKQLLSSRSKKTAEDFFRK